MLRVVDNSVVGDLRTVTIEGDRFRRVVFVIAKDDGIKIDYPDASNPNKILIEVIPEGSKGG